MSGRPAVGLLMALALAMPLAACSRAPKLLAQAQVPGASEVRWVAGDTELAVSMLGSGVLLLDATTGQERAAWRAANRLGHAVRGLAASALGETLAVATAESVRVFATRGLVPLLATPGDARSVALSDDGGTLAWSDGTVGRVVDVATGAIFSQGTWPIERDALAWGPLLRSFAVPIGTSVHFLRGDSLSDVTLGPFEEGVPRQLAFSTSGATLAVLEAAGDVSFWDVEHDRLRWRLSLGGPARAEDFAMSGNTWTLATSNGGRARLLWAYRGRTLADWSPHGGAEVRDLAFSLDGRRLATVGAEGRVRVWAVPAPRRERS